MVDAGNPDVASQVDHGAMFLVLQGHTLKPVHECVMALLQEHIDSALAGGLVNPASVMLVLVAVEDAKMPPEACRAIAERGRQALEVCGKPMAMRVQGICDWLEQRADEADAAKTKVAEPAHDQETDRHEPTDLGEPGDPSGPDDGLTADDRVIAE